MKKIPFIIVIGLSSVLLSDGYCYGQKIPDSAGYKSALTRILDFRQALNTTKYGRNDAVGKYAQVNGIKMYYEIYGKGKPLLIICGNGGSISGDVMQIPFFSRNFKVIVADTRGQGKTIYNSDSLTYSLLTEDYNALLNYLHIDSAYVVGQSDGAIIGLMLAARHPDKVKMLAALSPNIRWDSTLYPAMDTLWHEYVGWLKKAVKPGNEEALKNWKEAYMGVYHPNMADSELHHIKAEVMVMTSDRDLVRLSHIIEIFRNISKSELCVLPGSTHFVQVLNPVLFNNTVYRFFQEPFYAPNSIDYMKEARRRRMAKQ